MPERKEPTLGAMVPSRDEPELSRTEQNSAPRSDYKPARTAASSSSSKNTTTKKPSAPARATAPSKSSPLAGLALLVGLIGIGLAGFAYWQLLATQQQAAAAEQRLAELEKRLALSDDESSQSVTVLQSNLKSANERLELAHTEIRKLWDTRNVNKQAIAANDKRLDSVQSSVSKVGKQASEAQTLSKSQADKLKTLSSDVALQAEKVSLVSDLADGQEKTLRNVSDRLNRIDSSVSKLQNDLTRKVANHDEAIKAIDAYRLTTNREILQIKRKLGLVQ